MTLQTQTLLTYTALAGLQENWPGKLILASTLAPAGAALAIAANIVGAAALLIESNPEHLRDARRNGACDFVVNTLDEALRALKNEIRQHKPIAIGLESDPAAALAEIVERGVQPDLIATEDLNSSPGSLATLIARGAQTLRLDAPPPSGTWTLHELPSTSHAEARLLDARLLEILPPEDRLRRRWLQSAPRFFTRERSLTRSIWLTAAESAAIA